MMNFRKQAVPALFLFLISFLSSCSKDEVTTKAPIEEEKTVQFQATTQVITKTTLSGTQVMWSQEDCINVFDEQNGNHKFTNTNESSSLSATFEGTLPSAANQIVAVYPYVSTDTKSAASISTNLESTQVFSSNTSFNHLYNKSCAIGKVNEALMFKNLCGIIKLQIKGRTTLDKITFTVNSNNLSGKAMIDVHDQTADLRIVEGSNKIELTSINQPLSDQVSTFYIVAAPNTYQGFSIETTDSQNVKNVHTSTKDIIIKPSVITSIEAFDVYPYYTNESFTEESWTWE